MFYLDAFPFWFGLTLIDLSLPDRFGVRLLSLVALVCKRFDAAPALAFSGVLGIITLPWYQLALSIYL